MVKLAALTLSGAIAVALFSANPAAQAKTEAGAVSVTVKYGGKGMVDPEHKIWVWLFDSPEIGPGSIPIDERSIDKNGGTATFSNVSTPEVYIAVAYDEKGGFAGQAPPPSGSPIAMWGMKAATDKPQPVTPGPKGAVSIALSDLQRMP